MLICTDRPASVEQIEQVLSKIRPCKVVDPRHETSASAHHLVVCDVDLADAEARQWLRTVLERSRDDKTPMLCLLRDASQLTFNMARDMGATAVLSSQTHPVELANRIRQLLASQPAAAEGWKGHRLSAEVELVHDALQQIFKAGRARTTFSSAAISAGAAAVLEGLKRADLASWVKLVRRHDDVTYQHCLLVTGLVAAFAGRIGLLPHSQHLLTQAALVHDIGKAAIPTAILNKPGRLTPEEFTIVKTHPARGQEMLQRQSGLDPSVHEIAKHHHEYLDGSGYPDGLRGEQISAMVRAVTICDIFAALIERRPYKAPMEPASALEILDNMGGKLDRGLFALFKDMIETPRGAEQAA